MSPAPQSVPSRPRWPGITVRAIVESADRFLFLEARDSSARNENGSWYFLPGGHVNHGESLGEGLRRELIEEIGIEVEGLRPAFLREFIASRHRHNSPDMPPDLHVLALIFRCQLPPGEVPTDRDLEEGIDGQASVKRAVWLSRDQLLRADVRPPHIREALIGERSSPQGPSVEFWPEE